MWTSTWLDRVLCRGKNFSFSCILHVCNQYSIAILDTVKNNVMTIIKQLQNRYFSQHLPSTHPRVKKKFIIIGTWNYGTPNISRAKFYVSVQYLNINEQWVLSPHGFFFLDISHFLKQDCQKIFNWRDLICIVVFFYIHKKWWNTEYIYSARTVKYSTNKSSLKTSDLSTNQGN